MEKSLVTIGLFLFGLWEVCTGVMVRSGRWRGLLLYRGVAIVAPTGAFLIAIPMGFGTIAIGLMIVFPGNDLIGLIMIFAFLSGVILSFWAPDWLFPEWAQWLMNNYDNVLHIMLEEAQQMGVKEWEEETRTLAGLENWAKRVAEKRGLQSKKEMEKIQYLAARSYPQDIDPATLWMLHRDAYERTRSKESDRKKGYGLLTALVSIATLVVTIIWWRKKHEKHKPQKPVRRSRA
jgi:hypothetical protein